jgi:hypothetical protein
MSVSLDDQLGLSRKTLHHRTINPTRESFRVGVGGRFSGPRAAAPTNAAMPHEEFPWERGRLHSPRQGLTL